MTLHESVDRILAAGTTLTDRFYELFFERHPEARALFDRRVEAIRCCADAGNEVVVVGEGSPARWRRPANQIDGVLTGLPVSISVGSLVATKFVLEFERAEYLWSSY